MSLPGVISGVTTLADTGISLDPVCWDIPPVHGGPDVHLVGVPTSIFAMQSRVKVYCGYGGLEVLLCIEGLDAADYQGLHTLMSGNVADRLPELP
ncbi:hypothetical protein PHMEG_00013177 [Phytophthora megakarya]|uniref:Uncharacterized protein n=1 Tax=Phytophthora megakarya TaxID=4795 RepID=A0A225W9I5_9STRA|nr:hypothetical protein PHMEG_00013177 [Phytophthora megakarya]